MRIGVGVGWLLLAAAVAGSADDAAPRRATVTIAAFSDYHSHAVPFRSEGRPGQAGIARAIAFFQQVRQDDPAALIVSGGDMLNLGTPTWSDEYRCVEWPWLAGLVDAMALGNHELDYGWEAFESCRREAGFPVLAANLVGADGRPLLTAGGKPYVVREAHGRRIGLFAVAGPDFSRLVKTADLPPGARFADPVDAARDVVATLRNDEKVDAVVMIGHQHRADDEALAGAVPGIDLVFGTHSHLRVDLQRIEGTSTWFVSPFQYLTDVARVRLDFDGRRLVDVRGGLVRMDDTRAEDPDVAARIRELQARLEARRPERFAVIGTAAVELSDAGISGGETPVGNWATEVLRRAAGAHAFLSTSSSFRAGLGPGEVTVEQFHAAFPYPNRVMLARLTGAQVRALVGLVEARRGSDAFSQQSGVRWALEHDRPARVEILRDPARPDAGWVPVQDGATYLVATTDFQARVVPGYRELFSAADLQPADLDVHAVLTQALAEGVASAATDGRSGGARSPRDARP